MKKFVAFTMAAMFAFFAIPAIALTSDDAVAITNKEESELFCEMLLEHDEGEISTDIVIWLLCDSALDADLSSVYAIFNPSIAQSKALTSKVDNSTILVDIYIENDSECAVILASNRFMYLILCDNIETAATLSIYMITNLAPEYNFYTYVPD